MLPLGDVGVPKLHFGNTTRNNVNTMTHSDRLSGSGGELMNCEAQTHLRRLVTGLHEQGAWKCLLDEHLRNRAHTLKGIENAGESFPKCDF